MKKTYTKSRSFRACSTLIESKWEQLVFQSCAVRFRDWEFLTKYLHYQSNILFYSPPTEEEAYNSLLSLVKSKEKVFITQTKLLHEVTWKTIHQFTKMRASKSEEYLQKLCGKDIKAEKLFMDWTWWILGALPFPHLGECLCVRCWLTEKRTLLKRRL